MKTDNDDLCRFCGAIGTQKVCDLENCIYTGCENGKYGRVCGIGHDKHHIILWSRIKELKPEYANS